MEEKNEVKETTVKPKKDIPEIVIAILLGVVTLLTAWATWIGSLHGGNQATNYSRSNNIASDGNARYNEASQTLMQDMMLWSEISDLQLDIGFAATNGDNDLLTSDCYKLYTKCNEQFSETLAAQVMWDFDGYEDMEPVDAIDDWMTHEEAVTSPFTIQEYVDSYYEDANSVLAESEEVLTQGQEDNANGDRMGLVTVFYSVVLFLLGIINTFKKLSNKYVVLGVAGVCLVIATVLMLTVPMPTGFSFASFFGK